MIRLTEEQIKEKIEFIDEYTASSNPASGSKLDPNANITKKSITTLMNEINKDVYVQVNRKIIQNIIRSEFDDLLAEQYIKDIENHTIYVHDETSLMPYCVSVSMYPFLLSGMKGLGNQSGSDAPKHLRSFCGSFVNLVQYIASQFAGAVATVEFLMYFDYFARLDYGDNYLSTQTEMIDQELQGIVYLLNQDSAARGGQSVFWNISTFDKPFFDGIFGDFVFPDMTKPNWESLSGLQMHFHKWFRHEREKKLLTFPVVTHAAIVDENDWVDEYSANFVAQEMSKGGEFFIYTSNSADSLSSCCFSGETTCLAKHTDGVFLGSIKELHGLKHREKKNLTVFHDGSWVSAKTIEVSKANKKMYKITTSNKKQVVVTEDHLFPVFGGVDKRADQLSADDYLMFNTSSLDTYPEADKGLSYEDGLLIGAYLGDGSKYKKKNCESYEVTLSLTEDKIGRLEKIFDQTWRTYESKHNVVFKKTFRKDVYDFVSEYVSGDYCYSKSLNSSVLMQSTDFRKGILDGFYKTDGGNSNRIYTTSKQLTADMETLLTSLGMVSVLDVDDRVGQVRQFRDEKPFTVNHELNCIRWYDPKNKRRMKDTFIKKNGQTFFKIIAITEVNIDDDNVYCFEVKNNDEPYFTLPNGVITHNCRLKNELQDNTFSYSLGAGGVSTGSKNVITLNINRIEQSDEELHEVITRIHKYQVAYNAFLVSMKSKGFLPVYDAHYIELDKQYLTLGINGLVEAAEYKGLRVHPGNPLYMDYIKEKVSLFKVMNKEASKRYNLLFNTELVPAENLGIKNALWDKQSGILVPRDCYNSYFYKVEDESLTVFDKMKLHGGEIVANLDGGSALHWNHDERLSSVQYRAILSALAKTGCNYFCENVKKTACNECGHIHHNTLDHCVICGSKDVKYATRIIGYLKFVENFSVQRQTEEGERYYDN